MGALMNEPKHSWGMAIDLDRCTGCQACVAACHAENNLSVSDPESAAKGRAVHWIRVDRYYEGEFPDIRVKYRPVLCQQCDEAPCEPVCPVYATYHNDEGLNVQVYNRCVGRAIAATTAHIRSAFSTGSIPYGQNPATAAQPRCLYPRGRRDGEVYVLRAAHQPC